MSQNNDVCKKHSESQEEFEARCHSKEACDTAHQYWVVGGSVTAYVCVRHSDDRHVHNALEDVIERSGKIYGAFSGRSPRRRDDITFRIGCLSNTLNFASRPEFANRPETESTAYGTYVIRLNPDPAQASHEVFPFSVADNLPNATFTKIADVSKHGKRAKNGDKGNAFLQVQVVTSLALDGDEASHASAASGIHRMLSGDRTASDRATPLTVFVSYARDRDGDLRRTRSWLERVLSILTPAVEDGVLDVWEDGQIQGGDDWNENILDHVGRAKVFVLLVDRHFLKSKYIRETELPLILTRHHQGDAHVIPVNVGHCDVQEAKFMFPHFSRGPESIVLSKLQSIATPDEPLSSMKDDQIDQVLLGLSKRLRTLAEQQLRRQG